MNNSIRNFFCSSVALFGAIFVQPAQAEWLEYGLDQGVSRMIASGYQCEHRVNLRLVEQFSSGANAITAHWPLSVRNNWVAEVSADSYWEYKFSADKLYRDELSKLIPESGRIVSGGLTYGASHNRADYLQYLSANSGSKFDCSIELKKTASTQRIVPYLFCSQSGKDHDTELVFVLKPANLKLQESCL